MKHITIGDIQKIDKIGDKNLIIVENKDGDIIGFVNKEVDNKYTIKRSCKHILLGPYKSMSDLIVEAMVKSGYRFLIDNMS